MFCFKQTEHQPNQIPSDLEKDPYPPWVRENRPSFGLNIFAKIIKTEVRVMMMYLAFIQYSHPRGTHSTLQITGQILKSLIMPYSCKSSLKYMEEKGSNLPSLFRESFHWVCLYLFCGTRPIDFNSTVSRLWLNWKIAC